MKIALIGDSLTEGRPGVSFTSILKERIPNAMFINLGKPGETVKSLHTRLLKTGLDSDYDLAFLWIGVNDVYSKLLKVQAQPAAKDHEEFRDYYEKIVQLVLMASKEIVTVTPAIVGENMDNAPNVEIKELNQLIQSITCKQANVRFIDIQSIFSNHLAKVSPSDYISTKVIRVMFDVLFYKKTAKIDKVSKERGLYLTLDGIHLNSKGAQIVAEIYESAIKHETNDKQKDAIP